MITKYQIHDFVTRVKKYTPQQYWDRYLITGKTQFKTRESSISYHRWYMGQYLFYTKAMGFDNFEKFEGLDVLDHGCGTANSIVPLQEWATPKSITGCDISKPALEIARHRTELHPQQENVKFVHINNPDVLPFDDNSFDYIFSIGVVHHIQNWKRSLYELYRVLRPNGRLRLLLYNYDSIYVRLGIGYIRQIKHNIDARETIREAFRRSSEHGNCPVSHLFTREQLDRHTSEIGFEHTTLENAISVVEMDMLKYCSEARCSEKYDVENKVFLDFLEYDVYGRPLYRGEVAGIDMMAELVK